MVSFLCSCVYLLICRAIHSELSLSPSTVKHVHTSGLSVGLLHFVEKIHSLTVFRENFTMESSPRPPIHIFNTFTPENFSRLFRWFKDVSGMSIHDETVIDDIIAIIHCKLTPWILTAIYVLTAAFTLVADRNPKLLNLPADICFTNDSSVVSPNLQFSASSYSKYNGRSSEYAVYLFASGMLLILQIILFRSPDSCGRQSKEAALAYSSTTFSKPEQNLVNFVTAILNLDKASSYFKQYLLIDVFYLCNLFLQFCLGLTKLFYITIFFFTPTTFIPSTRSISVKRIGM
ncbi:hypothetical protein CEXT_383111 [Caerostris extrusa]|uniref:Uncharacterized protein n=1 Tax=Caerostris extrusa TaxID=172846 RepID=A0AAV4V4S1_CAEEX|nr:hypothetical protein CEXT_383111 [Caerostris extrusa]